MGSPDCYPGADARADEVIRLANHYRGAANDLLRLVEEKGARRIAPCRLCAVHAIELYLNAFLLKLGIPQADPRQRPRPRRARGAGQRRRSRAPAADGDPPGDDDASPRASVLRYDPGMAEVAPLNRLWATLDEIARKVTSAVGGSSPRPSGA